MHPKICLPMRRTRRIALGTGVAVAISLLAAWMPVQAAHADLPSPGGRGPKPSSPLHGLTMEPAPVVGGLSLPDAAAGGADFPLVAPRRGLLLVYFGYTSCPDICPTTLSDLGAALRKLGPKRAQRVHVAMVTVDPTRDTPEVLTGYLAHFLRSRYSALRTDDPVALRTVADTFGARYEVTTTPTGKTEVGHSALVYAVDSSGRVVLAWPFGVSTRALTADLATLLRRA